MDRKTKILKHINKNSVGIEIGPSIRPVAQKKDGFNVEIIDHLNQDELKAKYKNHNVNIENIEKVDYVWTGGSYSNLINKKNHYHWLIASHVIEHTPDLIAFINDCDDILKDDGVISLAIPDKRYCFDHFRSLTSLAQIIDSHRQKRSIHTPGSVIDYLLNVVRKNDTIAWNSITTGDYSFIHSPDDSMRIMNSVILNNEYVDVHAWCFTPHLFRLLISDLYFLGFIKMKEFDFYSTEGSEFFITLSRNGNNLDKTRLELLQIIESEIKSK